MLAKILINNIDGLFYVINFKQKFKLLIKIVNKDFIQI